jgi:hypothetical protein
MKKYSLIFFTLGLVFFTVGVITSAPSPSSDIAISKDALADGQKKRITVETTPTSAAAPANKEKGLIIDFPHLKLLIEDVDSDDYEVQVEKNTAVIKGLAYKEIDGKKISIREKGGENLSAIIRFEFGFLQYLTDEKPAAPIGFKYETLRSEINVTENSVRLPQFHNNYENIIDVYRFLGYADDKEFEGFLEKNYLETVKTISYEAQRSFYQRLLTENRTDYEKCCPEYIEQAERFFSRQPEEFKSFNDLALELYCSKIILQLSGTSGTGEEFTYYLIGY